MRTSDTIVGNWGSSKVNRRLPQGRAADGRPNFARAIFTRMPPSMGQPTMMPQVTVTRPATSFERIFMTCVELKFRAPHAVDASVARAPAGGWTVGTLFDAIAKGHPGYGDHTFFEGMYSQGNGYYGVMYGS